MDSEPQSLSKHLCYLDSRRHGYCGHGDTLTWDRVRDSKDWANPQVCSMPVQNSGDNCVVLTQCVQPPHIQVNW